MSGALATPSTSMFIASLPTRQLMRLVTKPGNSLTSTVSLPILSATLRATSTVSSVVSTPRTSSTSFMRWAGLKKCMAMHLPGRSVAAAISVGLMVEVFVARTVSGSHSPSKRLKSSSFRSIFSRTASTTSSAPETASSRSSVAEMQAKAACISPSSSLPFSTAFLISFSMLLVAFSSAPLSTSCSLTSKPPRAPACAMPRPITPAPTTAIFSTIKFISSLCWSVCYSIARTRSPLSDARGSKARRSLPLLSSPRERGKPETCCVGRTWHRPVRCLGVFGGRNSMSDLLGNVAQWAVDIVYSFGYVGVAVLIGLINLHLLPVPTQLVLGLAGFLVGQGRFSFALVLLASTVGAMIASLGLYAVGARIGEESLRRLIKRFERFKLIFVADLDRASEGFEKHGGEGILIGHLFPGVGALISIPAGIKRMPLMGRFMTYSILGCVLWNGGFFVLRVVAGSNRPVVKEYASIIEYTALAAIVGGVLLLLWRRWNAYKHPDREKEAHRHKKR